MNLDLARDLAVQLVNALAPNAPGTGPVIDTPDALDRALSTSPAGAVLTLRPGFVYPGPLTIRTPVTMRPIVGLLEAASVRMTRDQPLPMFRGGLTIAADNVTLLGLDIRHTNPLTDIVIVQGAHVTLDRCRIMGDPLTGGKRGISANSNGELYILRCYIDDCWMPYPSKDSQAIAAWDMGPGLLIEDCYLSAGTETLLIGGADASSPERSPKDITIRGCTITKNPAWQPQLVSVKNALELKDCRNVLIEDNDISQSWGGHGQDGTLLILTVRNQDGRAPWATIQDVTIRGNRFSHGASAINILGLDTIKETGTGGVRVPIGTVRPSVRMARVTISGNTFTDLDPKRYTGSAKLILIDQAPEDLTIDGTTFAGVGFSSAIYFGGGGPATKLVFTSNVVPRSTYGCFGVGATAKAHDFSATNPAWVKYTAGGTIANITETP